MIIRNMPFGDGFQKTPSYFKLGFGGTPILLPQARFVFTYRLVHASIGGLAHRFLTSPVSRRVAHRLRNG